MNRRTLALIAALLCSVNAAKADFAFTVGSGQTGFSFTASTGGTALCAASVTHCFASVPINTAGAAFFTSGAPGLVALTGTNNIATVTTVTGVTTVSTLTTLSTLTGGGAASAAADSGNPVKIGGKYNSSPITLTDGNRGDLQLDVNGYTKVNVATATGLAQGSTTSGQTGSLVMGAVTAATPGYMTTQTSPVSLDTAGNTRIINGASLYETVAASVTGQTLGPTGATGDYLSHCVVYPTSTTPGVVTVFDNASAAGSNVIAFPGGSSSVSNLVPFAIPVGAVSNAGAWKVTTGANLVVTCYGRFT